MTLIIARKTDSFSFIIADTFSENEITKEKHSWYLEPLIKIVKIGKSCVVAFSGNSDSANKCLSECEELSISEIINKCLESHKTSHSKSSVVDYVVCEISSGNFTFIKDGSAKNSILGYLGSKQGFEKFQKTKNDADIETRYSNFCGLKLVDGALEEDNLHYSKYVTAFDSTLAQSDSSFGGFSVNYIVEKGKGTYGMAAAMVRGPYEENELPIGGGGIIFMPQDSYNGGYSISCWGTDTAFAFYFPQGKIGGIFEGFSKNGFECEIFKKIDGYDFTDLAENKRCGCGGLANWKSFNNALFKARQHLEAGDIKSLEKRLAEMKVEIENRLSALNDSKKFDIENGFSHYFILMNGFIANIDLINCISSYLDFKIQLVINDPATSNRDFWGKEQVTWTSILQEMNFRMGVPHVKPFA